MWSRTGYSSPFFLRPKSRNIPSELNKSSSFTTPHWTAIDLKKFVQGSSSEVYLVVKDSRSSILEMYNIRTRSTVIIHEYDGTPFSGYILLASNLEGWILLSRNTHAYFLNLVSRDHSDLPMLNRNIGPSAQGGFRGSPNGESMLTVVLELEFHRALIVAHRPATGWLYFNVPAEVQMLCIESFKVTVNRIFWVASGLLFCCSHEQFLWRKPIAMGGYHKSVLDYRGDVYLLVVNQELTEGQIFYVNADNGDLITEEDFTGLIFTTRGAGGVVSPSGSFRVLGAGGLWAMVEGFEVSVGGEGRVIKSCNSPAAEDDGRCGCHFGWVAFGPRSE
ncbi:uncharacterized protein LOC131334219 [Rhododendron vialii]|uniref:uncharacterized protein LOC131334219 n=1 Tax=Rhododendron vialii TaxID=182163 RepID=UPI00265E4D82|nr:uncharacterized protein LOC131334219 [Rhododendron vialii]